jgi:hypothetical protein
MRRLKVSSFIYTQSPLALPWLCFSSVAPRAIQPLRPTNKFGHAIT